MLFPEPSPLSSPAAHCSAGSAGSAIENSATVNFATIHLRWLLATQIHEGKVDAHLPRTVADRVCGAVASMAIKSAFPRLQATREEDGTVVVEASIQ